MSLIFKSLQSLGTSSIAADQRTLLWTAGGQFTYASLSDVRGFINAEVNTRLDNLETNATPTIWPVKRTLTVAGPVTGSVQMDGSSNITLNLSMADGALAISKVAGLQNALDGKLASDGTAAAASRLATARAFSLTGVITAPAVNFNGSGNVSLSTSIADGALSILKTSGLQTALESKLDQRTPMTTMEAAVQNGYFQINEADGSTGVLPNGWYWVHGVRHSSDGYGVQWMARNTGPEAQQFYVRRQYQGTWLDPVRLYHSGNFNPADKLDSSLIDSLYQIRGHLSSGTDLNTVVSPGIYHQNLSASATTDLNYPVGLAGMLEVKTSSAHTYQTYHVYASSRVYVRARYNTTWSNWAEQHTTDSFNPAGFMNTTWTLTAGNGLSGGGTGAANRTISLGTPGTLSGTTTNNVTASSHTHALSANLSGWDKIDPNSPTFTAADTDGSVAMTIGISRSWSIGQDNTGANANLLFRSNVNGNKDVIFSNMERTGNIRLSPHGGWIQVNGSTVWHAGNFNPGNYTPTDRSVTAGNGLSGGGNFTANRTISLGTPGTLSGSTTNSVTTSSHTHALSANLSAWDGKHPNNYIEVEGSYATLVTDYDAITNTGLYRGNASVVGAPINYSTMISLSRGGNRASQVALTAAYTTNRMFFRTLHDTWNNWSEVWHSDNFNPSDYLSRDGGGTVSGLITVSTTSSTGGLVIHRTNHTGNATVEYKSSAGSLYAGNGNTGTGLTFNIGNSTNLDNSGTWFRVDNGAAYVYEGTTAREVYHAGNLSPALSTTSISAGSGLSGGGTLGANRTISLGTPGTITNSTTNSVSTSSHTHALSLNESDIVGFLGYRPVQIGTGVGQGSNYVKIGWNSTESRVKLTVDSTDMGGIVFDGRTISAGNGLSGGGTLGANRTISLGTPGTITNSTTNSVTSTSHTHALSISKSDVGLSNVENVAISTWDSSYITDSRGASRPPSYYDRRCAQWDFQSRTDTGAGGDSWTALLTVSPWSATSAGTHVPQQLAFTGSGGMSFRRATSDSAWSAWENVALGNTSASDDANTIAMRNSSADIYARLFRSTFGNGSSIPSSAAVAYRVNNSSDNYIRFCDNSDSLRNWLGLGATQTVGFQDVSARGYLYCGQANGTDTSRIYGGGSGSMFIVAGHSGGHIYFRPRGWTSTNQAYLNNNGTFYASDFQLSSDQTLKEEIKDLEFRGRLRPRHFRWIESGKEDFGFIAQEVQELYPEAIGLHEHGEDAEGTKDPTLTVSYPKLTAVLAHQVNQLEDEREELRQEVKGLRSEVSSLRQEVDTLKQLMLDAMRQR